MHNKISISRYVIWQEYFISLETEYDLRPIDRGELCCQRKINMTAFFDDYHKAQGISCQILFQYGYE